MDDKFDACGTLAVGRGAGAPPTELTIIVPTFNERRNVGLLFERLQDVLQGTEWEIVFVDDDSPDGTCDAIRRLAHQDRRVRLIERIGRRGLSSAVVEGVLSSTAAYFVVMDADLQHDETMLPVMLNRLKSADLDVVVGSRYTGSGSAEGLSPYRQAVSRLGGRVSRIVLGADLTDPMSGFFAVRRSAFDEVARSLSQQGFKILLDIFASSQRPLRFEEVPCKFHARRHGESKLDSMVAWEFGMLILDKLVGRYVPPRLIVFAFVGGSGLVVHLTILYLALQSGFSFYLAQTTAVVSAITWNYVFNNLITYRDRRLQGWAFVRGLFVFGAVCGVGAIANVGVAEVFYDSSQIWWLAGLAGAVVGVVWNFAASSYLMWRNCAPVRRVAAQV